MVYETIAEEVLVLDGVDVTTDATEDAREGLNHGMIVAREVVVKLLVAWHTVGYNQGAGARVGKVNDLTLNKIHIGHGHRIVELQSIGVEADKMDIASRKTPI